MFQLESAARPLEQLVPVGGQRLLLKGGTIISMDEAVGDLEQGDILIDGSRIAAIGPSLSDDNAELLDMRGMIITPGFVDCHRHAWEAQLRHLNPNSSNLLDYCCATHLSFAPHYRPIDIYAGTLLTAIGGIDAGITTIIDNAHNVRSDDHATAGFDAWRHSGVRAIYAPGPPVTGKWDEAGWPGERLDRLIEALGLDSNGLVTLGVMSQFDPEIWAQSRARRLPIVTEVNSPAMADTIRQFAECGLLGSDNIFNHITGMPNDALEILGNAGVGVNVSPRSDAQYGIVDGGMGAFQAALDAGLRPGFSIDNETSYSGDMFAEMRAELLLQRAMTQRDRFAGRNDVPAPLSVRQALRAATIDGARCASLDSLTGSLSPRKQADLIAIRATDRNLHPLNNALGAVVHGADRSNIDTVIVGGRVRKRDGGIVGLDERALSMLVEQSRTYLLDAYGYRPSLFCDDHTTLLNPNPDINRYWL